MYILFILHKAASVNITIDCLLEESVVLWEKLPENKLLTCELQNDLEYDSTAVEAISNSGNLDAVKATAFVVKTKKIPILPAGLQTIFSSLTGIDIDQTNLIFLDGNILKLIVGLRWISATNNKLYIIPRETFTGNPDLELINLTGNPIFFIDINAFDISLKFLTLTSITCLDEVKDSKDADTAAAVTSLKELTTKNCGTLEAISKSLNKAVIDLIVMSGSEFCVESGNGSCPTDCEAETLVLKEQLDNQIQVNEQCKNDTADLNKEILDLTNRIASLEKGSSCKGTCIFDVKGNFGYSCNTCGISIKSENEQAVNWNGTHLSGNNNSKVLSLIIDYQMVELTPSNIGNVFVNLENLVITSSKLRTIKRNDLKSLINLKLIDFSKNLLQELPSFAFDGLVNLEIVNLSDNKFLKVQFDWIMTANTIDKFYLTNNPLSKPIQMTFIWRLQKARLIDLNGTGYECSLDKINNPTQNFMQLYISLIKDCK